MAGLMRCNMSHYQGDKFIPKGAIRPAGHRDVLPEFFEPFEVEGDPAPVKKGRGK
jgi:hypothetical protein